MRRETAILACAPTLTYQQLCQFQLVMLLSDGGALAQGNPGIVGVKVMHILAIVFVLAKLCTGFASQNI